MVAAEVVVVALRCKPSAVAVVAVHSAIAVAVAVAGMFLWDVTAAVAVAGHDEPCHVAAVPGILPQSSLHALQDVCERGKKR